MTTSANSTESNNQSTTTNSGYGDPSTEVKTDEVKTEENKSTDDSNLDDYGYKKVEEKKDEKVEEKTEEKSEEDKKVENPATGYGEDDKTKSDENSTQESTEEKKDDEKSSEEVTKEEIETAIKELPESYDKERTLKFALENKMTKEQMGAYVELTKQEAVQFEKDQKDQTLATRKEWLSNLKNDSVFGGENFEKNVHRVEQTLDKYMPNMKKVLTDKGSMLPPYIMKDLLAISKVLNPTTALVNGESSEKEAPQGNFLDDMYK